MRRARTMRIRIIAPATEIRIERGGDATAERAGALAEYVAAGPAERRCRMKSGCSVCRRRSSKCCAIARRCGIE